MAVGLPILFRELYVLGSHGVSPLHKIAAAIAFLIYYQFQQKARHLKCDQENYKVSLNQLNLETRTLEIFGKRRANKAPVTKVILE